MAKEAIWQTLWRINQKLPILMAVLVLLNVLFFVYLTQFLEKDVEDLERRYISQQSEVRKAEQGGRSAESPLVVYARGIKDLRIFQEAIPKISELTGLVGELSDLAERSGLEIDRISYNPKWQEDIQLFKYSPNFVVTGSYNQIKKFTHKIEQSKRLVAINEMKLNRSKKDQEVKLSLKLTTYFRADAS